MCASIRSLWINCCPGCPAWLDREAGGLRRAIQRPARDGSIGVERSPCTFASALAMRGAGLPPLRIAVTPVDAIQMRGCDPRVRDWSATSFAMRTSCLHSSVCWCMSRRYSAIFGCRFCRDCTAVVSCACAWDALTSSRVIAKERLIRRIVGIEDYPRSETVW